MRGDEFMAKLNEIDEDLLKDAEKEDSKTNENLKTTDNLRTKENPERENKNLGTIKNRNMNGKAAGSKKTLTGILSAAAVVLITAGIILGIHLKGKNEDSSAGGTDGKINVTAEIKFSGVENILTNEEAYQHLENRKAGIIEELNASGVEVKDLTFTKQGYSHIRTGDKGNTLACDWRNFLGFNEDGRLVVILDVNKDSSGIHDFIAFGGPWFPEYEKFLKEHAGEELVYLYVGDVEAVVTPDNTVVTLLRTNISACLEEGKDYYNYFKRPENTFIFE